MDCSKQLLRVFSTLHSPFSQRDMTQQRSINLMQQHLNYEPSFVGHISKSSWENIHSSSQRRCTTASCNCHQFFCEMPAGWGGNLLWIDRCAQWYIIRLSLFNPRSAELLTHTHIHFSSLRCTTQLLTNNWTHRGMWLNAEEEGEELLLNHKLLQGSRAPAPHPAITIIVIIIAIPSLVLSFSLMSGCCQNNNLLSEERSACASRRFALLKSYSIFHIWVNL